MSGQINRPRVFGNFKAPKGYGRVKRENSKNYKNRPGMSDKHLDCVRSLSCCVCSKGPRSECHHLKAGTNERGMGQRSSDRFAVPLCRDHHHDVEHVGTKNEQAWFEGYGIDALALADALWHSTGAVDLMQRIVRAHNITET